MLLIVLLVAALLIGVAIVVVLRAVPDYRTAFLVDASLPKNGSDFTAITSAVGSAAQNSADGDSLSLRRFGGTCGDRGNTSPVVDAGTKNAQKISTTARALTPSGKPTLESGVLAAIDDFSGYYPFRARKRNRIIVVTSHGFDACTTDQAALQRAIHTKAQRAKVKLDFRFVGYKVPQKEQRPLAQLAAVAKAPKPRLTTTPAELSTTLKQLTVPESPEAKHLTPPTAEPPQSKPVYAQVIVATGYAATITNTRNGEQCTRGANSAITGRPSERFCSMKLPNEGTVTLRATLSGTPFPVFNREPNRQPAWYGCQNGPGPTDTCTLDLANGHIVCLSSQDGREGSLRLNCEGYRASGLL
ncbi:hypothetical protein E1264_29120, partial [Actinomadura sp. KC216]|uniref:hypothetical protein n=1 Tax=Actinomadura sp. KC216 TaxID=2530370 RepID=UPI0010DA3382